MVIPVEEYRVLRAKAYPVEHDPEPPPLDATLTRVDYDLHITGELAAGRANLTVDVLKDGWVRVPVPAGLLVREARTRRQAGVARAGAQGKGAAHLSALLSHAGRSVLPLDVDVPVTSSTGDESISLPSTESGVTRAAVQLPRQGIDLRVGGGLISEKSENVRRDEVAGLRPRQRGADLHLAQEDRGSSRRIAAADARIADATDQPGGGFDVDLCGSESRNRAGCGARGADSASGKSHDQPGFGRDGGRLGDEGRRTCRDLPRTGRAQRAVCDQRRSRLPRDGIIEFPCCGCSNTERDTGGVAVEILGAGEIKDQKAQGLEDADATDLGEMVASRQSPALVAFRARSGEAGATRTLSVNVARYDQQAVLMANIEEARYQVLMSADGKELVQARYAVRNNQRNFVKITLPPGATVWSASLRGKAGSSGTVAGRKPAAAAREIAGRRGRAGVRGRDSVSDQGSGVGGQRARESHAARAGSSDFADWTAALLSATVPGYGGAGDVPHAESIENPISAVLSRRP